MDSKTTLRLIAKAATNSSRLRSTEARERAIVKIARLCRAHGVALSERVSYTACGSPSDSKTTKALDNLAAAVGKAVQRGEIKVSDYRPSKAVQKRLDAFRSRPGDLDSIDIRYGGDDT